VRPNLPVSKDRIAADLEALACRTEPGSPYTRRAFTPRHLEGRSYLAERFRAAGLEVRVDVSGNLIGRRAGARPALGSIMLGSHSDTVPDGGRFDGVAGVVAALEVARALQDESAVLDHDLEVVDFLAEEVSIYGVSCVGSRGMTGRRPAEWLAREAGETTLSQAIETAGGDPTVTGLRTDIRAFLELHIEQGPLLEAEHLAVGVVTAIAGITRLEIVLEGRADHAGTTPMDRRRDALVAAAHVVLGVQEEARALAGGPWHFTATVGELSVVPNAANVVPSQARLLVDARAERRADMEVFIAALARLTGKVAEATGVAAHGPRLVSDTPSVAMDADVTEIIEGCAGRLGASSRRMTSGAGHDAAFMAQVSRAGMIFIPCRDGRSHAPDEWAENDDIALGTAVLFEAVKVLDRELKEQDDGAHSH